MHRSTNPRLPFSTPFLSGPRERDRAIALLTANNSPLAWSLNPTASSLAGRREILGFTLNTALINLSNLI